MKKTNLKKYCLAVLTAVTFIIPAALSAGSSMLGGSFTDSVISARAAGLGGAFTAVADDANAAWWNPAGLAMLGKEKSISATYIPQVYADVKGLSDMLVTYGQGDLYGYGALGGSIRYLSSEIAADYAGDSSYKWSEYTIALSWAMQIEKYIGLSKYAFPKIALGVNLKYFGNSTDLLVGADKISASGFGADLALMLALKENLRIGLVVKDLISQITWQGSEKQSLPYEITGGFYYGFTADFLLSVDAKFIQNDKGAPDFDSVSSGVEYSMDFGKSAQIQKVQIRGGFSYMPGVGSSGLAAGASIVMESFSVDYAYQHYLKSETNVDNHRFGLTIFF